MINFNVGAQRLAHDDARLVRIADANALVQRTLAQHGLAPAPDGQATVAPAGFPKMEGLLAGLKMPAGPKTVVPVPPGATFGQDELACDAGSRAYRTYVPASASDGVTGIVVMLHGCTQTPEDFAAGTGMNALAEAHRFVVIYPQQSRGSNAQSCWNWFSRGDQQRDRGEPAIIAGMTRKAMAEHGVPADRTFVAGLSAGAAMAVILAESYPDIFAAVGAHSGLPYGAAKDVASAFAAMAGNAPEAATARRGASALRTIVFHGTADATVVPQNGERIARDALDRGAPQTIQLTDKGTTAGRTYERHMTSSVEGVCVLEHWVVEGLGHAWSGGQSGGSYTDTSGPDASAEMVRFFFEGTAA